MLPRSWPKVSAGRFLRIAASAAFAAVLAAGIAVPARSSRTATSYIRGRLIDGNGKPIAVAQVLLMSIATSTVFSGAASGSDGTFSFYGMKPGPYGIIAQKTPACAISHAIAIKPGKTYIVLLRMPSTSRCYGATHFKP
jgi:hypothetical protein